MKSIRIYLRKARQEEEWLNEEHKMTKTTGNDIPTSQEVEEVALLHELGDDVVGGRGGADGEQRDQVTMAELFHHLHLQLELLVV